MTDSGFSQDRYELKRQLGSGGMGEVWEARDRVLSRDVAIKFLPDALADDPDSRARFQQEVTIAAAVVNPFIVPLFDVHYEDGRLGLVMALIKGPDLARVVGDGALDPTRALRIFANIATALQFVHDEGFYHRDVKPANILLGEPGTSGEFATLADFGVAKARNDTVGLTLGLPPGTPRYMAPEVWQDWESGPQSDQYAFSCVLFEMLTGTAAFDGETIAELREAHCDAEAVPDIRLHVPEAPADLAVAIKRGMAAAKEDRYTSIREFAEAVEVAALDGFIEPVPPVDEGPVRLQLSPNRIALELFGVAPDRDEKVSQLAMETYLTLWANGYSRTQESDLRSPKRRNPAVRSLALGSNFLEGLVDPHLGMSPEVIGHYLAEGRDFSNSANLALAQKALRSLIDAQTMQGSAGATLLYPFHEALLWFDARKSSTVGARWAVRKVNMRGTGVSVARMLLAPPSEESQEDATRALEGIRACLQAESPFSELAHRLDQIVPPGAGHLDEPGDDERLAWRRAGEPLLRSLAGRIARHGRNIVEDDGIGPSTKLMRLRTIFALDIAYHIMERSWLVTDLAPRYQYLVLAYSPEARRDNRVRIASEASYLAARQSITQALILTLGRRAHEVTNEGVDIPDQFEARSKLATVAEEMADAVGASREVFDHLAGRAFEGAKGGGYGRPVDAFRVLLESIRLLTGTGRYRWLRANPEVLGAMIGAVGGRGMEMPQFLRSMREEWGVVVGEAEAVSTDLEDALDGGVLSRNAGHMEKLLVASGLAQALSDQTCVIGQTLREVS